VDSPARRWNALNIEILSPEKHGGRLRHALSLRVFKLEQKGQSFLFENRLEQVPDWADSLIVDVGPNAVGDGLSAWVAWNSQVFGPNDGVDPITQGLPDTDDHPIEFDSVDGVRTSRIEFPPVALSLPLLGPTAHLTLRVMDGIPAALGTSG
jgi:hypothetical protein